MNKEEWKLLQKALNERTGSNLIVDGVFGNMSIRVLRSFQKDNEVPVTGEYDEATRNLLEPFINFKYIRVKDIEKYANDIQVDPNLLKAIAIKEARASGFTNSGRCLILFERHIFYKYALKKFGLRQVNKWMEEHPNICHAKRSQAAYYGGEREYDRLNVAKNLDPETALMSCSWGMFQIMGFNHKLAGYEDVGLYASDMSKSEHYHVKALANFIKNNKLLYKAFLDKNFQNIAYYYNGPAFKQNRYDTDLIKIYNHLTQKKVI